MKGIISLNPFAEYRNLDCKSTSDPVDSSNTFTAPFRNKILLWRLVSKKQFDSTLWVLEFDLLLSDMGRNQGI